jgi:drug/metabolite transporter (DMT)-like permease
MTTSAPAPAHAAATDGNVVRGILLIVLGAAFFGVTDALAKTLVTDLPVFEALWARYTFHLMFLFLLLRPRSLRGLVRTRRPGIQFLRGATQFGATMCAYTALFYLPLADMTAIAFVWPLIATVLAIPILGERVGPRRWGAVVVGLLGAMIVIRPGFGVVHWASFLALGMAGNYAIYHVLTRLVGSVDSAETNLFYVATIGFVVTTGIAPFIWVTPDAVQWMLMVGTGLSGAVSHFFIIRGLRHAGASALAPFGYFHLVSATVLGYLVFGTFPDEFTIAGALVIVASGLFLYYRERAAQKAAG